MAGVPREHSLADSRTRAWRAPPVPSGPDLVSLVCPERRTGLPRVWVLEGSRQVPEAPTEPPTGPSQQGRGGTRRCCGPRLTLALSAGWAGAPP